MEVQVVFVKGKSKQGSPETLKVDAQSGNATLKELQSCILKKCIPFYNHTD
jgi:hypothetical protein